MSVCSACGGTGGRRVYGELVGEPCQPLVWGPASNGELSSNGVVLPAGWVATCTCGWSSTGHSSEQGAEDAATIHAEIEAPEQEAALLAVVVTVECSDCGGTPPDNPPKAAQ